MQTKLEAAGWVSPKRVRLPGRDGTTPMFGVVLQPPAGEPLPLAAARRWYRLARRRPWLCWLPALRGRHPVVERIYAGPHGFHCPKAFGLLPELQQLVQLGFVVVQVDGMGTNGRGREFLEACWQNLRDGGLPDHKAWIRGLPRHLPELDVDLSRVGIYGGSAGGQNAVAALLDHGDLYSVAVADCGCHDNRVDKQWWNEAWLGWPVDDACYAANSNTVHAGRLGADQRLLLVVGETDTNVDPACTLQLAGALQHADRNFDLVVLVGAGHGAAETPYGARKRAGFLVRHLQPPLSPQMLK